MRTLEALLLLLLPLAGGVAHAAGKAAPEDALEFRLRWEQRGLSLKPRLFVAPLEEATHLGDTQVAADLAKVRGLREIKDGMLRVAPGNKVVLHLVLENQSAKEAAFSVAPHHIAPPEASVGFDFQCLCNGRTYRVPPRQFWIRTLALRVHPEGRPQKIELKHVIFRSAREEAAKP